jgi:hypothetical protein
MPRNQRDVHCTVQRARWKGIKETGIQQSRGGAQIQRDSSDEWEGRFFGQKVKKKKTKCPDAILKVTRKTLANEEPTLHPREVPD